MPTSEARKLTLTPDDPGPKRSIKIVDVETRGKIVKHTVFIIKCEPHFPKVISVARRFNHFLWLRTALSKMFPCMFVPPLPERKFLSATPNKNHSLEERRTDLQRFLNRLEDVDCFHAALPFLVFLTCPESTFLAKTKKLDKEMEPASADKLRQFNKECDSIKLPTDLNFEIGRYKDEFSIRRTELDGIFQKSLVMLKLHEKSRHTIEIFNQSLANLMKVEEEFPRRDLEKREQLDLKNWETWHTSMWNIWLSGFVRNIRYHFIVSISISLCSV